jgi:hypothetical protein
VSVKLCKTSTGHKNQHASNRMCLLCVRLTIVVLTTVSYLALPHSHAHGQLPYRDHSLITNVVDEGRPLVQELGGLTASGSGLWYRNDTLFSAQFFGAGRFVAFKILGQTQWRSYSIERVTTNITSRAVSQDGRYIVLGYEGGAIEFSDDGGKTFRAVTSPTQHNVNNIAISSEGTIVIGRVPEGHMFVSSDQGQTWTAETFPDLPDGSSYTGITDLKYSFYDVLSFVTAEVRESGEIIHMVFFRLPNSNWQVYRVGVAVKVFLKDTQTLFVTTGRPIPGRVDNTAITELIRVKVSSGRIDTAFSFTKESDGKASVSYVWFSSNEQTALAFTHYDAFSTSDTLWYREPYDLPVFAQGLRSIVQISATEAYAAAGLNVVRIQLSPISSIPRFLDGGGNVSIDMTYDRLPPRCVVYDMLGRVVHSNDTDDEQSWSPQFAGTYFLYDTKAAKLTAWQY